MKLEPIIHISTSLEGKSCRRLLKKYQRLCREDIDYDGDAFPTVTDVSDDDDTNYVPRKKKNFAALFARRTSGVVSEMGGPASSAAARASSTLITPVESLQENIGISDEESTDDLEPEERENEQQNTPKSTVFDLNSMIETDSIVLTPPPPCSPASPRRPIPEVRRGRGRPRRIDSTSATMVVTEPVEKRGRGRPKKTASVAVTEEQIVRNRRGRPRK